MIQRARCRAICAKARVWSSQSPHLRAIAALILLGSVVTTVAGWQYKSIAKEAFAQKDQLTYFFGAVTAYTGIISLVAQLVLTAKLLRRFGVGLTLLILPVLLMAGSVAVLVWGTIWAATFLRSSDVVIRYSADTSAIQLLYLPVPANIKLQVKSFIDTVVWKVGDGLAGLTLLLFATKLRLTPREVSVVTIILIGAWIVSAVVARQQYVRTLRANIQSVRLRPGRHLRADARSFDDERAGGEAELAAREGRPLRAHALRDGAAHAVARGRAQAAGPSVGGSADQGDRDPRRGRRHGRAPADGGAAQGRRSWRPDGGAAVPHAPRPCRPSGADRTARRLLERDRAIRGGRVSRPPR